MFDDLYMAKTFIIMINHSNTFRFNMIKTKEYEPALELSLAKGDCVYTNRRGCRALRKCVLRLAALLFTMQ